MTRTDSTTTNLGLIGSKFLKLDQSTPQTTVGTFTFPDVRITNSGTITRTAGLLTSVSITGGRTITVSRTSGYISSLSDGTNTWTYTRDVNNYIISWEVS